MSTASVRPEPFRPPGARQTMRLSRARAGNERLVAALWFRLTHGGLPMVAPRELNESLQKISAILALLRSDLLELAEAKAPAQRIRSWRIWIGLPINSTNWGQNSPTAIQASARARRRTPDTGWLRPVLPRPGIGRARTRFGLPPRGIPPSRTPPRRVPPKEPPRKDKLPRATPPGTMSPRHIVRSPIPRQAIHDHRRGT